MDPDDFIPPPPRVAVVIVAAGRGERLGELTPKQFLPLAGRPVFSYSLRFFGGLPFVVEIALVHPPAGLPEAARAHLEGPAVPLRLVAGGARRQDSVAAGLRALRAPFDVALVHDAARPFPDRRATRLLAQRAMETGGGLVALPCPDTVKRAGNDGCVDATLDRRTIWLAQTPQAIRADYLGSALALMDSAENWTDEAAVLERLGLRVALVAGSSANFKITTREDWLRAEALADREALAQPGLNQPK